MNFISLNPFLFFEQIQNLSMLTLLTILIIVKKFKLFFLIIFLTGFCFFPFASSKATMDWSKYHHQYFFAFNKALLKNDMELQKRGVVTIKRISFAASIIPQFQVNAMIEPALIFEDYFRKSVKMKVSQKLVFDELNRYGKELNGQDTFILYSHTHGVKNIFKDGEEWGGIILDINGATLPHDGVTTWDTYAEEILAIPAKNVIVLMMACYSGGFIDYLKTIESKWKNRAETGRNFLVITSQNNSSTSDPVLIKGELYNPFSAAVERALLGKADGFNTGITDGQLTYEEFVGYILETTHQLSSLAFPQTTGSYNPSEVLFSYR